jgi:hypothetical protein
MHVASDHFEIHIAASPRAHQRAFGALLQGALEMSGPEQRQGTMRACAMLDTGGK